MDCKSGDMELTLKMDFWISYPWTSVGFVERCNSRTGLWIGLKLNGHYRLVEDILHYSQRLLR